jgi:hypothetical protein
VITDMKSKASFNHSRTSKRNTFSSLLYKQFSNDALSSAVSTKSLLQQNID